MTPSKKASQILLTFVGMLALAGVGLSGYLSYSVAEGSGIAGCSGDLLDCDAVLATKWSSWLGLSVSWFGMGCYLLMALGALLAMLGKGIGWRFMEATCLMAVGSGIWFVGIQLTVVDSFCLYCLLTHLSGLLATLLMVGARFASGEYVQEPARMIGVATQSTGLSATGFNATGSKAANDSHSFGAPPFGIPALLASLAIVALIGGQLLSNPATSKMVDVADLPDAVEFEDFASGETTTTATSTANTAEPASQDADEEVASNESNEELVPADEKVPSRRTVRRKRNGSRQVALLGGKLKIDAYAYPILGSPEAEHLIVELMDYTCPHCREFHELLHQAIDEYGGQVAVIVLHSPSELLCNPYIKTSRPRNRGACRAAKLAIGVSLVDPYAFPAMHERLLEGERMPSYTTALSEAKQLVDSQKLRVTLKDNSGALAARVTKNIKLYGAMQSKTSLSLPMQIVGDQVFAGKPKSLEALYEQWEESLGITPPSVDIPF